MDKLTAVGLGLDHQEIRLDRTTAEWITAGAALRDEVAEVLAPLVAGVEQIGSSAVLGLLAKPIVDLAVLIERHGDLALVTDRLERAGWIYRGDAGGSGGHVFVLEARPAHRVAHLHVVEVGDAQWPRWLGLRDLLRSSAEARAQYEAVKARLAAAHGDDRTAYTDGKSDVVMTLLATIGPTSPGVD